MTDHFSEHRMAQMVDVELDGMSFRGKAAVFDVPWDAALTEKLGYEEIVKPGAFRSALAATPNFPLLREHDPKMLLATTGAGTLRVHEDGATSLVVEADLPPTPLGEETRTLIDRGDLPGMSYGVESTKSGSKMYRDGGILKRAIHEFRRMLDVSITYSPAYPNTSTELRSFSAVSLADLGEDDYDVRVSSDRAARIRAVIIDQYARS